MLEEWIRNIPLSLLRTIVEDAKVRRSRIWTLACEEVQRRRSAMPQAA